MPNGSDSAAMRGGGRIKRGKHAVAIHRGAMQLFEPCENGHLMFEALVANELQRDGGSSASIPASHSAA
jgi:hypothetical protein